MKTKLLVILSIFVFALASLAGCGNKAEKHEHNYTEEITVEATCETDGEATYTCECGDTYTEVIPATGHSFTNYVSNNDATYTADGTETAKCDNCDATDTRTAEGSMLTYTYTDMDATKYAKSAVNVRNLPNTDGEKLGGLSTNNEVKVTGQCNETGWYRIEYDGNTAYVSDSYLVDNKIETQTATNKDNTDDTASAGNTSNTSNTSSANDTASAEQSNENLPALYTVYYDNLGIPYAYVTQDDDRTQNAAFWDTKNKLNAIRETQDSAKSVDENGNICTLLCYRTLWGKKYAVICFQTYLNDEIDTAARGIVLY